ncbi:pullulanase-type alpha-1,6-glucosidase [Corynebacterium sp. HS2168-gen11]|uniref:pullulanase-type alpha-1,6-glucosidase n=1 Tax=Corynebacterium sp. HS2168-gen11 TaxID=2974027 RepID=UPI00216AE4F4|nr:pullulanase-type alpha-1,6-glucosidase [Corynebacterium sp. HS2168-gen11]MCS4536251.1 pullulanase-type alpha-1,6-glucosidase [Corynebacterium sp. HS2168-gen11]
MDILSSRLTKRAFLALLTSASVLGTSLISQVPHLGLTAFAQPTQNAPAVIAGDFQSELGCAQDWQETCAATQMQRSGSLYVKRLQIPAGSYNFKIVLDGNWNTSFGDSNFKDSNIPLSVAQATELEFSFDPKTKHIGIAPVTLDQAFTESDRGLITTPYKHAAADKNFYFILTDRFENGDTNNDHGEVAPTGVRSPLTDGFDPTDRAFYHGGDIRGIINKLDYIAGLGTTAIWLSPSFKNRPVQGEGENATAGYHGYWITDFTQIDPHLGSNDDMKTLIQQAHARGMNVYFDIVINHTADMIQLTGGDGSNGANFLSESTHPYRDAQGQTFALKDHIGDQNFPTLNANSFPYTVTRDTSITLKPDWLNDDTLYHNRGNTNWHGESVTTGDFANLDDLMTENPKVVNGMVDIYKKWVELGLDGFRIDTVKHVNFEFWQDWTRQIQQYAKDQGKPDFFMFGEVYDRAASDLAPYVRNTEMNSILDFGFQNIAQEFANGHSTQKLQNLFAADDYYTTDHSSASDLPTFLGNHDMGRIGYFVRNNSEPVKRSKLAHSLMFLTRGQPVVYYGDEQGFVGQNDNGSGDDKATRQDMFATQVERVKQERLLDGTEFGSGAHFNTQAPLYQHIHQLAELRKQHKALRTGAQIERWTTNGTGIYAFSRVDRDEKEEYLVALNNHADEQQVQLQALTKNATFTKLFGESDDSISTGANGDVSIRVPGLSAVVYKVNGTKLAGAVTGGLTLHGDKLSGFAEVATDISGDNWSETSFAWRKLGERDWQPLGTDTGQNARVLHDVSALPAGTIVEYRAVTVDADNTPTASSGWGVVGTNLRAEQTDLPKGAVLAGSFSQSQGCVKDWDEKCKVLNFQDDPHSDWSTLSIELPAGDHEYKIALNGSWDENYGRADQQALTDEGVGGNAKNAKFSLANPQRVTFYYNRVTHAFFNTAEHEPITLTGTMGGALGCPTTAPERGAGDQYGNWNPACLAQLMTRTSAGTYEFESPKVPAGDYQLKVVYGLQWGKQFGAPNDQNYRVDGSTLTGSLIHYTWTESNNTLTWNFKDRGSKEMERAFAQWLDERTIAIPRSLLAGNSALSVAAKLIRVDNGAPAIAGGTGVSSTQAAAETIALEAGGGLSADLGAKYPHLRDYLTFTLPQDVDKQKVKELLLGGLGLALFHDNAPLALTGVQIPGVLDAVYAPQAQSTLGVEWAGDTPTPHLWAPTAREVSLLVYGDSEGEGDPVETVALTKDDASGIWSVAGKPEWRNRAYMYQVKVWAPSTGMVETNIVTDPYSRGLTADSKRSVMINLADDALKPAGWDSTVIPSLDRSVDQMVYELHVRDFSIADQSVPADHRGKYLAFTDEGSNGVTHLKELAAAGVNSIHLLPTNDIASIPEQNPVNPTIPAAGPADEAQQAEMFAHAKEDGFNWGYDPYHYMTPEGSYAVDMSAAGRVKEYRQMVQALANMKLRVVSDQVYNHTFGAGQSEHSVLDKVVPGYYHRLLEDGKIANSTCCDNLATEHAMMQKLMVDSVVSWAKDYHVDGFRFDLMGHHSVANLQAVKDALAELTVAKDGIDGSKIYLYGEGWNFGEVANNARFNQAIQTNLAGTNIGTFNDRLRNGVHGHEGREQGFGTGLGLEDNGTPSKGVGHLRHLQDVIKVGMAGNLQEFEFDSASGRKKGKDLYLDNQRVGYGLLPGDTVNYIDAHDNQTLYDLSVLQLPENLSMDDRVRMNTVQLATVALGQSPAFWHAGTEFMRSKSLDRDSYNSGDHFNKLDLSGTEHNFGVGLPVAEKNRDHWDLYRGLLNNQNLKADAAHLQQANKLALELVKLRSSTPLTRLGELEKIQQKVSFPGAADGVIAMHIDDRNGDDVDPDLEGALIIINASPNPQTTRVASLKDQKLELSEHLVADTRLATEVKWAKETGDLTVPARSVVFMKHLKQEELKTLHEPTWDTITAVRGTTAVTGEVHKATDATEELPADVTYKLVDAPAWVSIADNGTITAAPGSDVDPGMVTVRITATYSDDSQDELTATISVTKNQADSATTAYPPTTLVEQTTTSTHPTDFVAGMEVSVVGTPANVTIMVDADGVLTVAGTAVGSETVELELRFPDGSRKTVEVEVNVEKRKPTLAETLDPAFGEVAAVAGLGARTFPVTGAGENTTFALGANAPAGVTISPEGVLTIDSATPGTYTVPVVVTYSDGSTETIEVPVTVKAQVADSYDPTWKVAALAKPNAQAQAAGTATLPDTATVATDKADWAVTLLADGKLAIAVPASAQPGKHDVPVTVTYADGSTDTTTVAVVIAPTWQQQEQSSTPNAAEAAGFSFAKGDQAPAFINVAPNGTITAADDAPSGTYEVPVTVTIDGVSYTTTTTFVVPVKPEPEKPQTPSDKPAPKPSTTAKPTPKPKPSTSAKPKPSTTAKPTPKPKPSTTAKPKPTTEQPAPLPTPQKNMLSSVFKWIPILLAVLGLLGSIFVGLVHDKNSPLRKALNF